MPTSTSVEGAAVVTVKLAVREPAVTVTLAGTRAIAGCVLDSATAVPPGGAGWFSVTIPVAGVPPVTLPGRTVTSEGAGPLAAGVTLSVPVPPTPFTVAIRLRPIASDTAVVVIGNEAERSPAGTFTRSGTLAGTGSVRVRSRPCDRSCVAVSFATRPPAGAGSYRCSIPVACVPPTTLGESTSIEEIVGCPAVGLTVNVRAADQALRFPARSAVRTRQ